MTLFKSLTIKLNRTNLKKSQLTITSIMNILDQVHQKKDIGTTLQPSGCFFLWKRKIVWQIKMNRKSLLNMLAGVDFLMYSILQNRTGQMNIQN